jgi:shikimate kinase
MNSCIVLIGPPGAGKTEAGMVLARKLSWEFLDTDNLIEERVKFTIPQIFQEFGEATFRHLECCLLEELAEKKLASAGALPKRPDNQEAADAGLVIATGGGLPITFGNFERLTSLGKVVFLFADMEVLLSRLKNAPERPLLVNCAASKADDMAERLPRLYMQRQPVYSQTRYKIDTSGLNPDQVADEVLEILGMSG